MKKEVYMIDKVYVTNFVKRYLPPMSEILMLKEPYRTPAVIMEDIDCDKIPEIIAAYKVQGKCYIIILKNYNNFWYTAANIKGDGYDINYLAAEPFTNKSCKDLIVGWQIGSIWAKLNLWKGTARGLKSIIKDEIYYSKIEVEDMPGENGKNGKVEIALWRHETGEAYNIEIYRWEKGQLTAAKDVYPYYFKKVVNFYKDKVKEMPEAAFYWYYLADAQFKANMPEEALQSIGKAIELNMSYPPKEDLIKLEKRILSKSKEKTVKLHPASIKTSSGVKWGYIDDNGEFVIQPKYEEAENFQSNGLATVKEGGFYGVIDEREEYRLKPKYDSINGFSENRIIVVDKGEFKVIDENGKEITSRGYDFISGYNEGRAFFGIKGPGENIIYGYLDREGREVIPAQYENVEDFKQGKAVVKIKENQYALINTSGQVLHNYNYAFVGMPGDGLLTFQKDITGKYGFIDEKGNVVIEPKYSIAQSFVKDRAVVNVSEDYKNKYGLIDKKDNFIIKPEYNDINPLGEDRFAVGLAIDKEKPYLGSRYALADNKGNYLTDFIYSNVLNYEKGLASANDNKNTFFINKSGNIVRDLPIIEEKGTMSFEGELIQVNVDYRMYYLDKKGKIVWKSNTTIPLNDRYKVIEKKFKPNENYLVYYPEIQGIEDKRKEKRINDDLKRLSQVKEIDSNKELDYSYTGDFTISMFKKNLLVIKLLGYQYSFGAAHGMSTETYLHIDLKKGKIYKLKDLFKENSNYIKVISDIIKDMIKKDPNYSYVWTENYTGIKEDQPFYVTEDALNIYFYPYEIAPYAAGFPTFKIPYKDIMNIIDKKGNFWRSFN